MSLRSLWRRQCFQRELSDVKSSTRRSLCLKGSLKSRQLCLVLPLQCQGSSEYSHMTSGGNISYLSLQIRSACINRASWLGALQPIKLQRPQVRTIFILSIYSCLTPRSVSLPRPGSSMSKGSQSSLLLDQVLPISPQAFLVANLTTGGIPQLCVRDDPLNAEQPSLQPAYPILFHSREG